MHVYDFTLLHEFKMLVIRTKVSEYSAYQITFFHSTQQQSYDSYFSAMVNKTTFLSWQMAM